MPNTKITREKLKVHFHYSKLIYAAVLAAALMIGNLTFTMTTYQAPNERRVDIQLVGSYADTSLPGGEELCATLLEVGQAYERSLDEALGVDVNAEDYETQLQVVSFMNIDYDENSSSEEAYYGSQKYMVSMAAQEGDIYLISRNQMAVLIDQNALVPLDSYIAAGVIDPGDRDLAKVTFDEVDDNGVGTGERYVYGLQASSLSKLRQAVNYDPTDKYMVIMQFSKNKDTAAVIMGELIRQTELTEEELAEQEAALTEAE